MTTTTSPTVEAALMHLMATRHPLSPGDRTFIIHHAELVRDGVPLNDRQRAAAYLVLARYDDGLADIGGYDGIEVPAGVPGRPAPTDRRESAPEHTAAVRIDVRDKRIHVRTPYALKDLVKSIPSARWDPRSKTWTYPASPQAADNITSAFDAEGVRYAFEDGFGALLAEQARRIEARSLKAADDLPLPELCKTTPWRHQLQGYHFGSSIPAVMLAMDMGTGKSKVTVDLICNSPAQSVLILCPSSVVDVWPREFRTHGSRPFEVVPMGGVDSQMKIVDRVERIKELIAAGRPFVVVSNYEALAHEPFKSFVADVKRHWGFLVLDESHRIKAPGGTWSKTCATIRKRSDRAAALSGTPLGQSPLDAFAQFRALDPTIFGTSFTSFKRKWFELGPVKTGRGGKGEYQEVIGLRADMADAFAEAFYSIAFRVEADDVLDLPPKQSVTRAALLPPPALKRYRELRDDLYTELESGEEVSAANVLVKLLRLQQLCGGTMTTDSGEQVDVHDAKQKLLADVLSDFDLREPVVVFARFHSDLDRIIEVCREQGRRYGEISGRTKNGLTNESKMNPNVDVVGVQMQAGSAGIDLTRARYGVYYSMGYSLVDYEQSWRRLLRPGQERPVLFVHLTMAGTTDEEVYDSLAENRSAIAAVLSTVVGIDSERAAAIAATIDSQSSDVESLLGNAR